MPHSSEADRDEDNPTDEGEGGSTAVTAEQGVLGKKKPYCLRVHLFQCRGLPSSEASGLLDPYIKVTSRFYSETLSSLARGTSSAVRGVIACLLLAM